MKDNVTLSALSSICLFLVILLISLLTWHWNEPRYVGRVFCLFGITMFNNDVKFIEHEVRGTTINNIHFCPSVCVDLSPAVVYRTSKYVKVKTLFTK